MSIKFKQSKKKWENDSINSNCRDYSFKSASGEDVDLLYFSNDENDE